MKIITLFIFIITVIGCNAQTYSLNTDFEKVPDYSYLKDQNNELLPYIGTYNANYGGNKITLFITKEEKKLINRIDKKFYRDVLSIRYIVKNSTNIVLQNTQDMTFQLNQSKFAIYSMRTGALGEITLSYGGTNCRVGNGKIILKKLNNTQISWEYRPNDIILNDSKCPPGTDINIYLPEAKDLLFTKQ